MPPAPSPQAAGPLDATWRAGMSYALLAYGVWGFSVMYWKLLPWVPHSLLIAQRVLWSVVFLLPLLLWLGQWPALLRLLRQPRVLAMLGLSGALITANWLIFVWAIAQARVTEVSLAYFINPLLSLLLGVLLLRERLRPLQWAAVLVVALGVGWMARGLGQWPWVSLFLATSFALYGLLRKFTPVSATVGLAVETLLMLPFALAYMAWCAWSLPEPMFWRHGWPGALAIAASGIVTALPLLWFANAAQRLPLSTLGLVQYLAPSIQLALAVLLYHEAFTRTHWVAFVLIWLGLALYCADALRATRQRVA
ncbi:EamA family transporter RarD [Vandammella animalimorsus]|uniref:EamA family transporter RarD n=1 Tax=Vandammella animalimorsus TaxID=2029117 RepID=UPI002691BBF5